MSKPTPDMQATCTHLDMIRDFEPAERVCPDCVAQGDTWVHLRICKICGYVGCCDDSKNKHMTRHHHATGHPIMASLEPGDDWMWCYVDRVLFEL